MTGNPTFDILTHGHSKPELVSQRNQIVPPALFSSASNKALHSVAPIGYKGLGSFKKVNGISEYAQNTRLTAPNHNKDY